MSETSEKPVLEPLNIQNCLQGATRLPTPPPVTKSKGIISVDVQCLLCDCKFSDPGEHDGFLKHLLLEHKLVIGEVKLIADFKSYIDYWREQFADRRLSELCTVIQTNSKPSDPEPSEFYYLLCDALPQDKLIRTRLQKDKLNKVLLQQQKERQDTNFSRKCLFCKQHFTDNRSEVFDHMVVEHNFSVGKTDNLVYTDELLDLLDTTLHNLKCLYCEKTFKDRHVLKEHMRKKQHKKINPTNTKYDQFYIINYLELGKNWESLQAENDKDDQGDDDGNISDSSSIADEWSEWREEGAQAVCLFCTMASTNSDRVIEHMNEIHLFNLPQLRLELRLSFYQQVKLINYIRRQMHHGFCPACQEKFDSRDLLLDHMTFRGHVSEIPDIAIWDQPQYFFPTYENDALLCGLDDDDTDADSGHASETSASGGGSVVVAEEFPVHESILMDKGLRDELLAS